MAEYVFQEYPKWLNDCPGGPKLVADKYEEAEALGIAPANKLRVVVDDTPAEPATYSVGKGPRGLWFVSEGDKRVSTGFQSEDEANAERERLSAPQTPA